MESVELAPLLVTALTSVVIPLLTGLLTKLDAPSSVKSITMLVLATVNGLIVNATMTDGSAVITKEAALAALISILTAAVSYDKLLKPIGATTKLQAKTANVGIGKVSLKKSA